MFSFKTNLIIDTYSTLCSLQFVQMECIKVSQAILSVQIALVTRSQCMVPKKSVSVRRTTTEHPGLVWQKLVWVSFDVVIDKVLQSIWC